MCLIMTICTAIVFSFIFLLKKRNGKNNKSVFMAMLMFWAASLMWSMDGIASVLAGEGFFDLSMQDTILGVIIVMSGLIVFVIHSRLQKLKRI